MGSCTSCHSNSETLHIISVVFNPSGYNSRVNLYNEYRERIEKLKGVKLYTVECLFEGQSPTVANRPQDTVVRAQQKLWLKENLINIGVRKLPKDWKYMAWVDGDIEFHQTNVARKTISALKVNPIVQMWKDAHFLGPSKEVLETCTSFGYFAQNNLSIDTGKFHKEYPHPGFAWAMTRSAFENIGGLPEFSIVGSGDNHFAYGLIGRVMDSIPPQSLQFISDNYKTKLFEFQENVSRNVWGQSPSFKNLRSGPGFVDTTISHHWHGDWKDRNYVKRWECLKATNGFRSILFQPDTDLHHNKAGVLQLSNTVFIPSIERYFDKRKEDGMVVNTDHKNKHRPAPQKIVMKALPPANTNHYNDRNRYNNTNHYNNTTHYNGTNYLNNDDDCGMAPTNDCHDYSNGIHCDTTYGGGGGGGGGGCDVFSASNHAYC